MKTARRPAARHHEGITEFLPISAPALLMPSTGWATAATCQHLDPGGAILAVVRIYRQRLWDWRWGSSAAAHRGTRSGRLRSRPRSRATTLQLLVAFAVTAAGVLLVKALAGSCRRR